MITPKKSVLLGLLLLVAVCTGKAQDLSQYQYKQFISGKDTLLYRMLLPQNFDPAKEYPVLFFLHGRGEQGHNNEAQLTHGGKLFLREDIRQNFPAIVIFPQCPTNSYWANVKIDTLPTGKRQFNFVKGGQPMKPLQLVLDLMKQMRKEKFVDEDRLYVGGLSMGGMGTLEVLRRKPQYFAAAFAICGGDNVANVPKYKKVPLWVFHGGKDDVVVPTFSENVVKALKAQGAKEVRFTLYPEANHNSWDSAFAEPELLPWLFSHEK